MKIGFISDLHIDFNKRHDVLGAIIKNYNQNDLNGLFIAGDISNSTALTQKFLNLLRENGVNVFAIYGNHDYYSLDKGFELDREEIRTFPMVYGKYGFIADTGWYNYTWHKMGSIGQLKKGKTYGSGTTWPDHRFIKWPHENGAEWFCQESISEMKRQNAVLDAAGVKNKIIMTHMVPHYELLEQNMEFVYTNPFFGSEDLSQFVKEISPDYCVFGHTHFTKDKVIGNTHYICAPLGYDMEWGSRTVQQRIDMLMYVIEV